MSANSASVEVQLAVYDLSRGMARSLSTQFLGPNHAIDIIPHTGIVVFGKEYYFGGTGPPGVDMHSAALSGGITMSSTPYQFRASHGIQPIQIISLGHTKVSQQEFESWCQSMMDNGTYAGYNYNLIQRNCNNFSHDAALKGLKLNSGVPNWILDVPHRFISSPMGQMIRPMLEQMQITGPTGGGGGVGGFQSGTGTSSNSQSQGLHSNNSSNSSGGSDPDYNPWAGMGTPTPETTTSKKKIDQLKTPILDSHNQPLLSNDTNVVQICIQKLKQSRCFDNIEISLMGPAGTCNQQYEHHQQILDEVGRLLLTRFSSAKQEGAKDGQRQFGEEEMVHALSSACSLFLSLFDPKNQEQQERYSSEKLYILMLLRLIILQPHLKEEMYQRILENISQFISMIEIDANTTDRNHQLEKRKISLRSMSWCVISNGIGKQYSMCKMLLSSKDDGMGILNDVAFVQNLVDLAIMDTSKVGGEGSMNMNSVEMRRCACAFLYNFILLMSLQVQDDSSISNDNDAPAIPEVVVTILCGAAEGLMEDKDSLCLMRRLLVIGKILMKNKSGNENGTIVNSNVATLLADIGYLDTLISLKAENAKTSKTHLLAEEIVNVINVVV